MRFRKQCHLPLQQQKYLRITMEANDMYSEKYNIVMKDIIKMMHRDWEIYHAVGLEESILWNDYTPQSYL